MKTEEDTKAWAQEPGCFDLNPGFSTSQLCNPGGKDVSDPQFSICTMGAITVPATQDYLLKQITK